ncbi:MAG TPA: FTR1 family protein [Gemmatimonadaceae bacterium]|nr:FTR1 family protein [Gemmatimonadaceae bacterium]
MRTILNKIAALAALAAAPALHAQEHPAKRLSSIVGVAVEEYAKGIDPHGRLISAQEYQETVGFLADARDAAERLSGDRAATVRAVLDTLVAAVEAKATPDSVNAIHGRFMAALGNEGALELPQRAISLADGRTVYEANCASCHGARGMGDGPAAKGMSPAPPAIGDARTMTDATPALLYRVLSVGVPGTQMPAWGSRLTAQQRWDVVSYVQSLHASQARVLEGEGLFLQRCASCHGATGALDGPDTHALTKLPPEIGSFAWQAEHSDAQIARVIRAGMPGTAMPPSPELSDSAVASMVAYIRTLPARRGETAVARATAADTDYEAAARTVLATLDQALASAQAGRPSDAGDQAFDAYIAFEPLETPARAKSPGLVAAMERHFADFKGAIKHDDVRAAQRERDAIEANLPSVVELTRRTSDVWGAFLQSFLIILREGFEAILVIGAVAAFLRKTGNADRLRSIWLGTALGVVASAATAVILQTVLRAVPASRDLLEGITMLIAVVVLFSVSYWLISRVEAAKWQQFIREKVSSALEHGGGQALAFVAFLAVYREGAETALFYQALFGEGGHVLTPLLLGIVFGFIALAIIFTLFYRFGIRIPLRPFFAVTSVLLYYMAFVFTGKGIHELQEVDAIPTTLLHGFPHVEAMGIFPTLEALGAQLMLLVLFLIALVKTFWPKRAVTLPTVAPGAPPAAAVDAHVSAVEAQIARLEARLAALERGERGADADAVEGGETVAAPE